MCIFAALKILNDGRKSRPGKIQIQITDIEHGGYGFKTQHCVYTKVVEAQVQAEYINVNPYKLL